MRKGAAVVLTVACVLGLSVSSLAQEQNQANAQQQATRAPVATGSSALRKAYPGGRDESDLTVQPRKRITRKESSEQEEIFEGEGPGAGPSDSEGFGE